jgi:hypothetical protein
MAGRVYTVQTEQGTYTNAGGDFTLLELVPAASDPITLIGIELVATSEVAEAQEEWIRLRLIRYLGGTFTSSNGSSQTPVPLDSDASALAAGFTAETFGASIASSTGTTQNVWASGFNVRAGYGPVFLPPEFRIPCLGVSGNAIVLNGMGTVTDDVSMNLTAWVQEGL